MLHGAGMPYCIIGRVPAEAYGCVVLWGVHVLLYLWGEGTILCLRGAGDAD